MANAKVEVAVQVAQRWILARLRNRRFFSLAELNAAIRQLRDELNMRIMRGYGASRADLFATLDRPHLQPLPEAAYAFARWNRARVAPDYHVEMDSSWYSVPFGLIREEVDVRISGDIVEIFHKGQRVASHLRCPGRRSHVTLPDHMPSAHRRHAEWTPARMLAQAAKLGPSVTAFCETAMADRPHPEQGFRTCLGVLALAKCYDATRLDAACRRALTIRARSVASIRSILKSGLDRAFIEDRPEDRPPEPRQYPWAGLLPLRRRRQMLTHLTSERLTALGLAGMARALDEQRRGGPTFEALGFEDQLGLLVDREAAERDAKRLTGRLKFAALRQTACVEDLDLRTPRGLDRAVMAHLIDGGWIDRHENLLITGQTGLGKSWIACALGHKACRDGRSVVYHRVPRLFEALALARGDGRHTRMLKAIARTDVLILDDWGLAVLAPSERRDLLEILEDRHGRGSTIITSQLPVEHWHEAIGDPTLADAILDRLVHNAHRLQLSGESMAPKSYEAP